MGRSKKLAKRLWLALTGYDAELSAAESLAASEIELVEYTGWTLKYIREEIDPFEIWRILEIFRARKSARAHVESR